MRRYAHIDKNQPQIVKDLRSAGISVLSLAPMGKGCPDILAATNRLTAVIEIKNPDVDKTHQQLTEDEKEFHTQWRGKIHIVKSSDEALAIFGIKSNLGR